MEQKSRTFLEELQALDESVKRRVLTVATVVVMVVVAYVWVGYFNGLVAGSSQEQSAIVAAAQTPTGGAGDGGYNFWQSIKSGWTNMENTVRGPGHYTITPQ